VTMWGMADDDTWLDSYPVSRTDYPLPFNMELQAKPAYWGIVDEKELPGYGLKFSSTQAKEDHDKRTITITATNGDVGPAYNTQINSVTLRQVSGRWCKASVTAPSAFPIVLGTLATSGSATATFAISLQGCDSHSKFEVTAPWSSATYETGTFSTILDLDDHGGQNWW